MLAVPGKQEFAAAGRAWKRQDPGRRLVFAEAQGGNFRTSHHI